MVLGKALDVLFSFDESHPHLTIQEISERIGLPRSTAYRYVRLLVEKGLLEQSPSGHTYRLGLRILELSRLIRQQLDLTALALPVMREIAAAGHETVLLAAPDRDRVICVEQVESPQNLRISFARGTVFPYHASAPSKALLAFQEAQAVERILSGPLARYTENTVTDPERLRQQLAEIRAQGFCVASGELGSAITGNPEPITGIAAPILDPRGRAVAAISITAPTYRVTPESLQTWIRLVQEGARRISRLVDG